MKPRCALVRAFHRQQHRAAPFAADPNALDEPNNRQDHRAPDADHRIARHKSHGEGGQTGDQQCGDQGRLAADAVAEMPEDRSTDRASDKADGVDGKRLQYADQRVGFGKEQLAEDQTGDDAVEQEVVPFDRRADGAGDHRAPQLSGVLGLGYGPHSDLGCGHLVSSASATPALMRQVLSQTVIGDA